MQDGRKHFNTLCGSVPPSPFCPLFSSYLSHLFRPFSVTQGLNLVSTWVQAPHLGTFIWFQYLNFRPWCLSSNFLHFLLSLGFNIYASPVAFLQLLAFILFQYLNFPPCPSTTSCIHLVSYVAPPWPPRNFLQAPCFNILKLSHTCASQQLPAFMRFQYLGFPPLSLHNFLHALSFGFNTFALIWSLYFPPA